jgi:hypothetical protein
LNLETSSGLSAFTIPSKADPDRLGRPLPGQLNKLRIGRVMEEDQIQHAAKKSVSITKMKAPNDQGQHGEQLPLATSGSDQ